MTNFERIKSMDAYDMAKFLNEFSEKECDHCAFGAPCGECDDYSDDCASGYYKWLMQEVDE